MASLIASYLVTGTNSQLCVQLATQLTTQLAMCLATPICSLVEQSVERQPSQGAPQQSQGLPISEVNTENSRSGVVAENGMFVHYLSTFLLFQWIQIKLQ